MVLRRWSVLCLSVPFLLLGCGTDGNVDRATTIFGTVTDVETGAPLVDAKVETTPATRTVQTDAEGRFEITDGPLLGQRYQVATATSGYQPQTRTITASGRGGSQVDFALELIKICTPGAQRCALGGEVGVETCEGRGASYRFEACPRGQACLEDTAACTPAMNLVTQIDGNGSGVIISRPAGINCGDSCERAFPQGTMVTLEVTALPQSTFDGWGGDCAASAMATTCTVQMDQARQVSARFTASGFALTVSARGPGDGTITSAPAGIDCPDACSTVYDIGQQVQLTATPAAGSTFGGWQGDCSGAAPTCMVTLDQARDVRARFETQTYPLMVQLQGTGAGLVSSMPDGIDCGADCAEDFAENEMVTLTAAPAQGSDFVGWGGDCTGTGDCMVTMDAARNVSATFDGIAYSVTVQLGGQGGGQVVSNPAGIDCGASCQAAFGQGTMLELTATPDASSMFSGWGGACAGTQGAVCMLNLTADESAVANFDPNFFFPLTADPDCALLAHLDAPTPLVDSCGGAPDLSVGGTYAPIMSRTPALADAMSAGGVDEEGFIDLLKTPAAPPEATVEMTIMKQGAAFDGRPYGVLYSDQDDSEPAGAGVALLVYNDGRLVLRTRDGMGGTTTSTAPAGTVADMAWHHVAATVSTTTGLRILVDGVQVAQEPASALWTASSSTAWVGAQREGVGVDAIHRFNGALDEVRVSSALKY